MVLPTAKKITYIVNFKRVIMRKLVIGIADGIMKVDGKVIYEAKVGLFASARSTRLRAVGRWPQDDPHPRLLRPEARLRRNPS